MPGTLLVSVRFHDGRYHGVGDWPPAPARLFQALVAGAARGDALGASERAALSWLETLAPPVIAAPTARDGQGFKNFVPNNDLDAVGGDPRRIGEIRAPKAIKPHLFDAAAPFLYAWHDAVDDAGADHARGICSIADRLYQLGRGVDMAWARAEIVEAAEIEPRLAQAGGAVFRPHQGGAGKSLLCPQKGSLASLEARFGKNRERIITDRKGRTVQQLFSQPPKPRFRNVSYDSPPVRKLFDLHDPSEGKAEPAFAPWSLARAVCLVERLRDKAATRLRKQLAANEGVIDRVLVGRDATEADKIQRVRIIPLPSIGFAHADHAIRRVLIEIPPDCPIPADDIAWSFSGLDVITDTGTGEIKSILSPADDESMFRHYGIGEKREARLWRTVTPAALPHGAARHHQRGEQKNAAARLREEGKAVTAVRQALRHAGIAAPVETIRVQREPFTRHGERAESFATPPRFTRERLWHVEIAFKDPVRGPLVIGDGRYLGLGLMAAEKDAPRDTMIFALPSGPKIAVTERTAFLRAVRRALMALSRDAKGDVPRLFSGHEADGAPAGSGRHEHIFLAAADLDADGGLDTLLVAAPWVCDHSVHPNQHDRALFDRIVGALAVVRAGRLGIIHLTPDAAPSLNRLIGPSRVWESDTPYRPARHAGRGKEPTEALLRDVSAECQRRGLPAPMPELLEHVTGPKDGIAARLRLRFAVAVEGPIMLGRDSHHGGGLFVASE
ncbi:MAG TPA: type I-U CRISPR-associated protein Csb2 [Stellaceae bacterium]